MLPAAEKLASDIATQETHGKKFELPGSKPHYAPSLPYTITHMRLFIEPDFSSGIINCKQSLHISILRDIADNEILFDASELQIASVSSLYGKDTLALSFYTRDDKLIIKLLGKEIEKEKLLEGQTLEIMISYSAKPRKGFHFIRPDEGYPRKQIQAWTQGETTESRFWFPCIDHPQVKFSSEILIAVPHEFIAISNGTLVNTEQIADNKDQIIESTSGLKGKKKVYTWSEPAPHPAYLTSIVIGRFEEMKEEYRNSLMLYYYFPEERKADALRSFEHTKEMLRFFEDYLGISYPYTKYSQVTVEDFVYGGMENSSCTTLTSDTLHDKRAHLDFTSDHLISHELAHQWFGDLVTCRDWQHIWLNEGFATYCEALYWEASRGADEFLYYVMQTADDYFEEASNRYTRPIVTNVYKHPDDLFDRHSYEKGGCVLHMLRHLVGDKYFRRALKTYLRRYSNGTTETDDLHKIMELESGTSLQQFFDQWIFAAGHPELKVEYSEDSNSSYGKVAKVKIEQVQSGRLFEFCIDIKMVLSGDSLGENEQTFVLRISDKETMFQIPVHKGFSVKWFSIDPLFKVLKKISLKIPKEMLVFQLQNGSTVVERVEAARALKEYSSDDVVEALEQAVLEDKFWGVSAEAAKTLGSIKTDSALEALKKCLSAASHPKIRRALVKTLAEFKGRKEILAILEAILLNDGSYFVQSEAATAMGKTKYAEAIPVLKKAIDIPSFQDVVAQGAIAGLKEFQENKEIATLFIEKSMYGNPPRIREAAAFALGKFANGNAAVVDHLKTLLFDKWFRVRINACRAFADAEDMKAIADMTVVAEHDLDHRVRRVAEECINLIRDASTKPKELSYLREEVDRIKSKNLEIVQKMDRLERQIR
jgi:aminopeptidase N